MLKVHPALSATIDTDTTDRIAERVAGGGYDLGFATAPVVTRGAVDVRVLASRPWGCVFPPSHPLSGRPRIDATKLERVALIGFSPGMSLRARVQQEFASTGMTPEFAVAGQTIETLCALAAAGAGGAVIHPFAGHVAAMHGLEVTEIEGLTPLDLVLVTPADGPVSRLAADFVARVEAHLAA